MKERPILFSGPMVRAILEGRKTQTRRIVKRIPCECGDWIPHEMSATTPEGWQKVGHSGRWWCECCTNEGLAVYCPYGPPGDRLWVRESFVDGWPCDDGENPEQFDADGNENPKHVWYRADDEPTSQYGKKLEMWVDENGNFKDVIPWKPSIHMPRWVSRITLEITGVRVERLYQISNEDAIAEGYENRGAFLSGEWAMSKPADSWVWVIEFKKVTP